MMTASLPGARVEIAPVASKADFEAFIRLPDRLGREDPNWRAPLLMERREALSAKHNPFFAHAEVAFWLARRAGRVVGRVSAQLDQLAPTTPASKPGHFGLIAAEDDAEVFAALMRTAEAWLAERGCTEILGPFNLGINEELGLLIDGFDAPPMIMMGHDPAYAARRLEALGYAKAKDVFAMLSENLRPTGAVANLLDAGHDMASLRMRPVDMKRFDAEVATMVAIFNDAWSRNWGFTPLTEAETKHLAASLRLVLDARLLWFLQIDGVDAGFAVCLPDVNEAARGLGGRLWPFGWAKLLWRLKVRGVKACRMLLMGVRRDIGTGPARAAAPFLIVDRLRREADKLGYTRFEISWILEDNRPAVRMAEALGARAYKTYRVYRKPLSTSAAA